MIDDRSKAPRPWRHAVLGLAALVALTACSPAAPPPAERKRMTGGAGQALVNSQAHLMGELPAYGNVTWERRDDVDGAAVLVLAPNSTTPTITARIRDGRIVELEQKGPLSRRPLSALTAAAGVKAGQHAATAEKVEALIAQAKASGQPASATIDGVTYVAAPSGDAVKATLAP